MQRASFKFVLTLLAMILIISAAAVPLPAAVLPSPTPQAEPSAEPTLAGHWEGIIELPGQKLEINIDFVLKEGAWTGDISIPVQKSQDLPLIGIVLDGFKAAFAIQGIPGEPTFKGEISADGKKMTGTFTQGGAKFPFSLELGADPTAKIRAALEGFDQIAEDALKALKVTGAAMAVVKNDKVVYAKGFGYKDVENKIPATPDTIFAIGSSSKAFTVFALGRLVDEGKLEWEAPVRNYIPWFKLYDKEAGARLSVRDLVTHRSGLPRHDLLWYNNKTASREDLVRALAYLPPTADLREKWQYNNLMFLTAGYLLETLTGKPWEDAVRSLVFEPLGMKRSNFSVLDSQKDSDFAFPYNFVDKAYEKLPFRDITNVGPAGSINSSVNEMARWVAVHLADGKFEGRDLLSSSTVSDMHNPHMVTGAVSSSPDIAATAYAMGWFTDVYRGHRRVHHGGNIDGFSAQVAFLPDDGLGFVVLTNMNGTSYPELLVRTATDKIPGLEAHDWIGDAVKHRKRPRAQSRRPRKENHPQGPRHETRPSPGRLRRSLRPSRLRFAGGRARGRPAQLHLQLHQGRTSTTVTRPSTASRSRIRTFKDFKLTFRTDVTAGWPRSPGLFEPTIDDIVFNPTPANTIRLFLKNSPGATT